MAWHVFSPTWLLRNFQALYNYRYSKFLVNNPASGVVPTIPVPEHVHVLLRRSLSHLLVPWAPHAASPLDNTLVTLSAGSYSAFTRIHRKAFRRQPWYHCLRRDPVHYQQAMSIIAQAARVLVTGQRETAGRAEAAVAQPVFVTVSGC